MADKNINTEFGFYFENSSINPSDLKFESKSYMEAFLKISQDRKVLEGDFNGVVHLVTMALQQTLGVSRVSYWKYLPQKDSIYAEHVFPLSEEVPKPLPLDSFPVYGKAIKDKGIIAAHHARRFEKTEEFLNAYLIPEDIYSLLDAPVIFEGNLLGIICCEHKEEVKKWSTVDVLMVGIFSGLITIAWQNKILHEQQEKIAEQLQSLEKFNHHVSSKNEELETNNLELSYELAKQNKVLKEQNFKLSEYAKKNSHHLRAPLSSILSLVELSKNLKNYKNDEEWLGHLSSACAQLDNVVREMNETLTNDNKLQDIFKEEPI